MQVGPALYALGALMLVMVAADAWLDEHALWEAIGRREGPVPAGHAPPIGCDTCGLVSNEPVGAPCPRCFDTLRLRKPESLARTWALLTAAAVCYIPANLFPVMTVTRLAKVEPGTILGGVQELVAYRMWPLAALVFVASVLVPVLKLVSLSYMLVLTQRRSGTRLPGPGRGCIGSWTSSGGGR